MLDFSVDQYGRYTSDDPQKLSERMIAAVQVLSSDLVHRLSLRQARRWIILNARNIYTSNCS